MSDHDDDLERQELDACAELDKRHPSELNDGPDPRPPPPADPFEQAVEIAAALLAAPAEFVMRRPDRMPPAVLDAYFAHRATNIEVRRWISARIRAGEQIHADRLRELAAEVIERAAELPPRRRGGPVPDEFTAEHLQRSTVRLAVRVIVAATPLKRTRNDSAPPRSACDAVVEGGARHGIDLTYDQVRKISER